MGVALRKGVEGEGWIGPLTVPTSLEKGWEREVNPYLLSTVPLYRITNSHCEHGVYYHICVTQTQVYSTICICLNSIYLRVSLSNIKNIILIGF